MAVVAVAPGEYPGPDNFPGTPPVNVEDTDSALFAARALVADLDDDNRTLQDPHYFVFFGMYGVTRAEAARPVLDVGLRSVRLVAATALETIAVSEVLTSKVIRTAAGISTDGAKVSAELRARAAGLRALVEAEDLQDAQDATGGFQVSAFGDY